MSSKLMSVVKIGLHPKAQRFGVWASRLVARLQDHLYRRISTTLNVRIFEPCTKIAGLKSDSLDLYVAAHHRGGW